MDKNLIEVFNVLRKNKNSVKNKKWICIHKNCNNESINSHLLQQNGILNNITEDNHLIEFSKNEGFEIQRNNELFQFKRVGIKNALSISLFCSNHDIDIFKNIETMDIKFETYGVQLLFSYRALCAELRRKQMVLEEEEKNFASPILKDKLGFIIMEIKHHIESLKLGIKDLTFFKNEFEKDLENPSVQSFEFKTYKYSVLEVCTSAVFSPLDPFLIMSDDYALREKPFEFVVINIIPQQESLFIIAGYHKSHATDWIKKYIKSLDTNIKQQQEMIISNILAERINTWALSNSTFQKIEQSKRDIFINYWTKNYQNLAENQHFDINLFS